VGIITPATMAAFEAKTQLAASATRATVALEVSTDDGTTWSNWESEKAAGAKGDGLLIDPTFMNLLVPEDTRTASVLLRNAGSVDMTITDLDLELIGGPFAGDEGEVATVTVTGLTVGQTLTPSQQVTVTFTTETPAEFPAFQYDEDGELLDGDNMGRLIYKVSASN